MKDKKEIIEEVLKLIGELSSEYGIDIPAQLLIEKIKEIK